jgi:hypothetical protein
MTTFILRIPSTQGRSGSMTTFILRIPSPSSASERIPTSNGARKICGLTGYRASRPSIPSDNQRPKDDLCLRQAGIVSLGRDDPQEALEAGAHLA